MRKFNKLLALLLTLTLCLSMAVTANADATVPTNQAVYITKDLKVAEGTTVPSATFKFTFTFNAGESVGMQGNENVTISEKSVTFSNTDTASNGVVSKNTEDILAGLTFPHAGVYAYTVTESITTFTNTDTENVAYDQSSYILRIYVKNTENSTAIASATIAKGENKLSSTNVSSTNGFKFTNTYTKTLGASADSPAVTITNQTVGEYADMTKEFSFNLTVAKPDTAAADVTTYKYVVVNDGTTGTEQTGTYGTAISGIKLDDDDYIAVYGVVAGSKYSVTQDTAQDYTTTIQVNGTANTAVTNVLISDTGINTAEFTNTYKAVSYTGISLNNSPFLLMIGVSAMFLLLFVTKKRREEA